MNKAPRTETGAIMPLTQDPVRQRRQRIARAAIPRREDLDRVGVEDGVEEVGGEGGIRAGRRRGREEEDARQHGGDGEAAGDAEHGDDQLVTVRDVGGRIAAPRLDVGNVGLVQGIARADEGPNGHDQGGRVGRREKSEESGYAGEIDLFKFAGPTRSFPAGRPGCMLRGPIPSIRSSSCCVWPSPAPR